LKVCLVSSGWVPIIPGEGVRYGGGIESQVYGLAKALAKLCEVHLITVRADSASTEKSEGTIYHKIALPSTMPASESLTKLAYIDLAFAFRSKKLHESLDVDIVHCNTKFPAAASLLNLTNRPLVFTAHNWKLWEGIKPEWKNRLSRAAYELDVRLEKLIAQRYDHVIAVSEAMKKGIVATTGVASEKVEAVPNAVDSEIFHPENVTRKPSVLYVGRITAEKGVDILIKAMARVVKEIREAELIIVGPKKYGLERGSFEEQLAHLTQKLGIAQHVVFTGTVSTEDLRKLYSQSSVSCLPSVWQEPFGLTLIEAMACETPVIGSNVGGIPEIISSSKSGILVEPNDVDELAYAIIQTLSNSNLQREFGRNGRKAVTERYTFSKIAEEIHSIYARLLN
jgi:glycosyltransferase involved in cell wall biosynthesis